MQLGMIGLGRMGASMVSRLLPGGHQCVVFDMKRRCLDGPLSADQALAAKKYCADRIPLVGNRAFNYS